MTKKLGFGTLAGALGGTDAAVKKAAVGWVENCASSTKAQFSVHKKTPRMVFFCALVFGMAVMGCATSGGGSKSTFGVVASGGAEPAATKTTSDGRAVQGDMPKFVQNASKNAGADVLVGVGSAKIGAAGLGAAQNIATARARAQIGFQLNAISDTMITDVTISSDATRDAISYQENVNRQLSHADVSGVSTIEEGRDGDNNYWVVVTLGKIKVVEEIKKAHAAANLSVPKAAAIDALSRMDSAFEKVTAEPIGFSAN